MANCPACDSTRIETTRDFERNMHILRCRSCGEMYAFRDEDLHEFGFAQIVREWYGSYVHQKRLTGGGDDGY